MSVITPSVLTRECDTEEKNTGQTPCLAGTREPRAVPESLLELLQFPGEVNIDTYVWSPAPALQRPQWHQVPDKLAVSCMHKNQLLSSRPSFQVIWAGLRFGLRALQEDAVPRKPGLHPRSTYSLTSLGTRWEGRPLAGLPF